MRLSTGNQILGKIAKIDIGKTCVILTVEANEIKIRAAVSKNAYNKLNMKEGIAAIVAINAFDIMLAPEDVNISAGNKLLGRIKKIDKGEINCNVYLKISDEDELCAAISTASFNSLNLTEGMKTLVIFNISSVIVAC